MKVEVEVPVEFQGPVTGSISSKRGVILGTESRSGFAVIDAEVPLSEMFGYSNDLRSMTQGKGGFSMEFLKYQKLPARFQEEIVKKAQTLAKVGQSVQPIPVGWVKPTELDDQRERYWWVSPTLQRPTE